MGDDTLVQVSVKKHKPRRNPLAEPLEFKALE
ncbi:hypothetical protein CsSME_00039765 [Camellia sinensis var. sinensis]